MRYAIKHNVGKKLKLDEVQAAIGKFGYISDMNTTFEEFSFRNGPYHLRVVPYKSRVEIVMHRDTNSVFGGHKAIHSTKDIDKELIKVKKALEDIIN